MVVIIFQICLAKRGGLCYFLLSSKLFLNRPVLGWDFYVVAGWVVVGLAAESANEKLAIKEIKLEVEDFYVVACDSLLWGLLWDETENTFAVVETYKDHHKQAGGGANSTAALNSVLWGPEWADRFFACYFRNLTLPADNPTKKFRAQLGDNPGLGLTKTLEQPMSEPISRGLPRREVALSWRETG
jgi:hypothetical protein